MNGAVGRAFVKHVAQQGAFVFGQIVAALAGYLAGDVHPQNTFDFGAVVIGLVQAHAVKAEVFLHALQNQLQAVGQTQRRGKNGGQIVKRGGGV